MIRKKKKNVSFERLRIILHLFAEVFFVFFLWLGRYIETLYNMFLPVISWASWRSCTVWSGIMKMNGIFQKKMDFFKRNQNFWDAQAHKSLNLILYLQSYILSHSKPNKPTTNFQSQVRDKSTQFILHKTWWIGFSEVFFMYLSFHHRPSSSCGSKNQINQNNKTKKKWRKLFGKDVAVIWCLYFHFCLLLLRCKRDIRVYGI